MPEAPDFDAWAHEVCAGVVIMRALPHLDCARAEALSVSAVTMFLKHVWNARGAADLAAIGVSLPPTFNAFASIRKLDA